MPSESHQKTSHSDKCWPTYSPNVFPIPDSNPPAYMVTVPVGVISGQKFPVIINGHQLLVTCPLNARAGFSVGIVPPPRSSAVTRPPSADAPFGAIAGSQPPKEKVMTEPCEVEPNDPSQIKLKYDKDRWTRTVRATDLKFQWIRTDDNGEVDLNKRFNFDNSAYVRKLEVRRGDDPRIRRGILSLVPAAEAVIDSAIKSTDGRTLITYSDLAQAQVKNFDEKKKWFQDTCARLCLEWNEGHMRMNVRRQFVLGDSLDAVLSLGRKDLRKRWVFEFIGEECVDIRALAREWFELVCQETFDPARGLWMSSTTDPRRMTINPASELCYEDHLALYRFLGRVIGKALFDRQLVKGHMAKHIYKHMLGWPIQFKDLESVDDDCYRKLKDLQNMIESGEDVSSLGLHFATTTEIMGIKDDVELVKGGKEMKVTNDNLPEYVEAWLKYKLMDCVTPQLNELLLGFLDVIPEPLLTIFDFQELEQLMCGGLADSDVKSGD